MNEFLQDLFDYNFSINKKLIFKCQKDENKINPNTIKLFSHILNAHEIWNARIEQRDAQYGVWDIHVLPAWEEINRNVYQNSTRILENYELNLTIEYVNTIGEAYKNQTFEMLYHIVNHSNYHRAQIAKEFVKAGLEPLISDYIFYKRRS